MTIIVKEKVNERIDKYLSDVTDYSRSLILKMIKNEDILVNDNIVKASYKVAENDEIKIIKEYVEEIDLEPENIPLDIIFENENVILVNKPSGMVVHPGSGNKNHTLVNALLYHTKNLSEGSDNLRPGIVHRIDKDTSGLILIAKNNKAHEILADDFKHKRVKRKYIALVKGILAHNNITIDAPIGRDKIDRKKMMVTDLNSKDAVTHIKVLKRYHKHTLIECELETGRTHQIRVHLAYIGHPIFNDPVYQKDKTTSFGQFLHSSEITFKEPITKEQLHFKVDLPEYFQNFLDNLDNEE